MHNIHYPFHKNAESAKLDEETKRDLRTHHFQMGKIFDKIFDRDNILLWDYHNLRIFFIKNLKILLFIVLSLLGSYGPTIQTSNNLVYS